MSSSVIHLTAFENSWNETEFCCAEDIEGSLLPHASKFPSG